MAFLSISSLVHAKHAVESGFCDCIVLWRSMNERSQYRFGAPMQMVSGYFDFVLQSVLIFGISFELPLALLLAGMAGLVDHRQLWRFGRYFILIAFTVGAIFSPPDVVSQTLVSVPLCLLYFFSILLVYLFGKKKPAAESTENSSA